MFYPQNKEKELSASLFQNPTAEYRGAPFWAWNCGLTKQLLTEQIEAFRAMGFGGFHMHPRTGFDVPYLGKEHMDFVKFCVGKARENGMYAYLYDEDRWPSGAAGGIVTKDEKYRQRYLRITAVPREKYKPDGSLSDSSAVSSGGEGRLLACYDVLLDENGCLQEYRAIGEEKKSRGTKWYVYLETPAPSPWFNNQTYADTLNKAAIDRFIHVTYDTYLGSVGGEFGKTIPSVFTDEPQFSRKTVLSFPEERKDVILPWTDDLADTFREAYGEDLLADLPQLIWELPGGKVSTVRYHYHDHVTERFTRAFADSCGKWCGEHGLMLTGHMMEEPTLKSQTASLGEAMRAYRSFQLPGIDMLCNRFEYNTAKQAQSASHQFGRQGVLSELYGVTDWTFDFRGHKIQGDWQAALGVTTRVPHLTWASMAGDAKRDYPASIGPQSPWYREYSLVENHFARLNTALTRGKPVVRVGVIHPVESYWLHWGPSQQTSLVREQLESNFASLTEWLLFGSIDFDFISESLLPQQCESASVPFPVGKMAYDALLVPDCETLRSSTLDRLEKFRDMGGKLIFLGEAPTCADAKESGRPHVLYEKSAHVPFDRASVLSALEDVRTVELRGEDGNYTDDLIYQLRKDETCFWLFVAHGKEPARKDLPVPQKVRIAVAGNYSASVYDTVTGEIRPMETAYSGGFTRMETVLYNQDSLLLRLSKPCEASSSVSASNASALPAGPGKAVSLPQTVPVTLEEPNVLLLDYAQFALDGEPYGPETEILRGDNLLRKRLGYVLRGGKDAQPWTMPKEKPVHTARLRVTFESEFEAEGVSLAVEDAERVGIIFNGTPVESDVTGYYVDRAIRTVALGGIQKGENILELSVPFGNRTNLEWCYILGNFGVKLAGPRKTVTAPVMELGFGDITSQGLPFYGGNVVYHIPVKSGASKLMVHVPHYRGALLSVGADGHRLGRIAFAPYDLSVPAPENGVLDLTLFGNRYNTFGCLHWFSEGPRYVAPAAWRTCGDEWTDGYRLSPAGILSAPEISEK